MNAIAEIDSNEILLIGLVGAMNLFCLLEEVLPAIDLYLARVWDWLVSGFKHL